MSRIDELVAESCPDGVPFERLGQLVRIRNGKDHKHLGAGDIPVYGTGGVMLHVNTAAHPGPSVLIPRKGSLGNLYFVDQPFWTVDTIFYTEIGDRLEPKFFYYYLQTQHLEELNQAGGVPSLTQTVLNELRIPVPPPEVQREIVRILDAFKELETDLETDLETELEARQLQYEHHRDALLYFGHHGREWLTLRDVAIEFGRGKSRHRPRNDARLYGGRYPFIQTGDIRNSRHMITEFSQTYNEVGLAQSKLWPRGTICITIAANIAETGILDFAACFPDSVIGLVVNMNRTSQQFVEYLLQSAKKKLAEKGQGTAQANINLATFEDERFPFPPPEEQERIVAILDSFDALISDLSASLHTELGARRNQYEFYRDKLFTFDELAS